MGYHHGHHLFRRHGLFGAAVRPGLRGCHPHRHHRRGHLHPRQTQKPALRERAHPVHRGQLRRHRGRRHLHPAGHLHHQRDQPGHRRRHPGQLLADFPLLPLRRLSGNPVPDPVPQIFRLRHARQIPVPGGHRHHRDCSVGRQGRQPSQTAVDQRANRWFI